MAWQAGLPEAGSGSGNGKTATTISSASGGSLPGEEYISTKNKPCK